MLSSRGLAGGADAGTQRRWEPTERGRVVWGKLLLWVALLAGIVILTSLTDRLRIPLPVLLTIFGLLVPLVPGLPLLEVDSDMILPLVLPPLLFAATQRATAREFRENARPILVLAVGLTVATAAAVAVVAHAFGMGWAPAFVLGAIVSPPDPVAATAVARRLRLPGRLVTVLEGEGMFNDATALVLYKVAIGAVLAGELSGAKLGTDLVLALVVGAGVGIGAGWLTTFALARLHLAAPETTVTLAAPFVVYLAADHFGGSGVLAVLGLGLYLRTYSHTAITSGGWLLGRAVWRYADYIITSLVFVFIGFELPPRCFGPSRHQADAIGGSPRPSWGRSWCCAFAWLFPAVWLSNLAPAPATAHRGHAGWQRETFVTAWAGHARRRDGRRRARVADPRRSAASRSPKRSRRSCSSGWPAVLVTLVVQGLTLARWCASSRWAATWTLVRQETQFGCAGAATSRCPRSMAGRTPHK